METLTVDSLSVFLTRFSSFYDAVIRRLELSYLLTGVKQLEVTLSVQDCEDSDGWSNITLIVNDVSELVLREGKATCQVLSSGISIQWFNGQMTCTFSPYSSEDATIEDVRKSDFYAVGTTLVWQVVPYSEE